MEKILTQQAGLLQKLETLSKQDKAMQAKHAKLLAGSSNESSKGIKQSLDEGNKLAKEQNSNIKKLDVTVKESNKKQLKSLKLLSDKNLPKTFGEALKSSAGNLLGKLNPFSGISKTLEGMKGGIVDSIFGMSKREYINDTAKDLQSENPNLTFKQAKQQAKDKLETSREANKLLARRENALGNDTKLQAVDKDISKFLKDKKQKDNNDPISSNEEEREDDKNKKEQLELLKQIVDNTEDLKESPAEKTKTSESKGPGLMSTLLGVGAFMYLKKKIMGFFSSIGASLLKGLRAIFSVKFLVGALKKVFLPAAIIGSIFSGVKDAIEEFKESGSIFEALKAGLGGILDFLTFGLVNGETLNKLGGLMDEYLIEPIKNFISGIKKWISDKVGAIPGVGKYIKQAFGADDSTEPVNPETPVKIETAPSSSGTVVTRVSNENEEARLASPTNKSNNVINAPTTNISGTSNNNFIKPSIRNIDNSYNNLVKSKYSYI